LTLHPRGARRGRGRRTLDRRGLSLFGVLGQDATHVLVALRAFQVGDQRLALSFVCRDTLQQGSLTLDGRRAGGKDWPGVGMGRALPFGCCLDSRGSSAARSTSGLGFLGLGLL